MELSWHLVLVVAVLAFVAGMTWTLGSRIISALLH